MKRFSFKEVSPYLSNFSIWARPTGRAYFFFELLVANLVTYTLIEENYIAQYALPLLFLLDTKLLKLSHRVFLGLVSFLAIPLGSALFIFILPVWGVLRSTPAIGIIMAFAGVVLSSFTPYLVGSLPSLSLPINAQSIIHLLMPNVLPFLLIVRMHSIPNSIKFIFILLTLAILQSLAAVGGWLDVKIFTNEIYRIFFVGVPIFLLAVCSKVEIAKEAGKLPFHPILPIALFLSGTLVMLGMATERPITKIVFDESHGDWETTIKSFRPEDFGRKHTYTYGLLADYAKSIVGQVDRHFEGVPNLGDGTVFVIKMPSKPFDELFRNYIIDWVMNGGRLLIIADHTDLYDSAQILNKFLEGWASIEVGANAVFDKRGFPNKVRVNRLQALLGKINSDGSLLAYQTGSAFRYFPLKSTVLSSYEISFAEPGDYSRPNRFGALEPKLSLPYANHASAIGIQYGKGGVVVIADSTQWSNFSIYKKSYKNLFKNLIGVLEAPDAMGLRFYCLIFLTLILLVILWKPIGTPVLTGAFLLGCTVALNFSITKNIYKPITIDSANHVEVITGSTAHLEILPQLIPLGERAYPRIISSLSKYGFSPIASNRGITPQKIFSRNTWLFLEPDFRQLPKPSDLREFLKNDGKVAFLFGPEQARNERIWKWVEEMGLSLQERKGLGYTEDSTPGLFNRNGSTIIKDVRVVTSTPATSMLVTVSEDTIAQVYQVRTKVGEAPQISGRLIISFMADQFSDAVIGDVWEGIDPSVIGEIRENQFSSYFLNEPNEPQAIHYASFFMDEREPKLNKFAVIENGKMVLSGNINDYQVNQPPDSLGLFPERYLASMQNLAFRFIGRYCPSRSKIVRCENHLIGYDMTEWMVAYQQDTSTKTISNIELIHDRNFSGIGANYNIVFSE